MLWLYSAAPLGDTGDNSRIQFLHNGSTALRTITRVSVSLIGDLINLLTSARLHPNFRLIPQTAVRQVNGWRLGLE